VLYDTNFYKTFVAARLRLQMGDPEAIAFHAGQHDLLFEHLTSEYPVRTEARGRVVDEWKMAGRDNHWLDLPRRRCGGGEHRGRAAGGDGGRRSAAAEGGPSERPRRPEDDHGEEARRLTRLTCCEDAKHHPHDR
jgi:hypothetical protein